MTGSCARLLIAFALVFQITAQPADTSALQKHIQEGDRALAEKRYADAAKAYEQVKQLSPSTAEVYAKLGLIYFQQRKYEEAVPVLRRGLELKPALANANLLLAMSLSELGRYKEAAPGLLKGFSRSAEPALKRMSGLQLQRAYTGLKQDDKAVEVALELYRLFPEDPEILYHTGRLFGNFSFLSIRKLTEVAPSSVWKNMATGEVDESQGSYERAVAAYRRVLEVEPRRPGMHFRIGRALLSRSRQPEAPPGTIDEAVREFEQELQLDPTNANAAYELGEIHRSAGRLPNAREAFEVALKHYPEFEEAHIGLGRVLLAMGKPEAALAPLAKAVKLNPDNAVAYFQLAQVQRALGNTAEQQNALAEFRRIRAKWEERQAMRDVLSPREVTKQQIETGAIP